MSKNIPVQACVTGYNGPPCTLMSLYDPQKGVLLVHKISALEKVRQRGCLTVTTISRMDDYDALFTADHIGEAIEAYESLAPGINYTAEAMRANPGAAIQVEGYNETGVKRTISDAITNEKLALLATCWVLASQDATTAAIGMADEIAAMIDGRPLSIGGEGDVLLGSADKESIGPYGWRIHV